MCAYLSARLPWCKAQHVVVAVLWLQCALAKHGVLVIRRLPMSDTDPVLSVVLPIKS